MNKGGYCLRFVVKVVILKAKRFALMLLFHCPVSWVSKQLRLTVCRASKLFAGCMHLFELRRCRNTAEKLISKLVNIRTVKIRYQSLPGTLSQECCLGNPLHHNAVSAGFLSKIELLAFSFLFFTGLNIYPRV